ncbi:hypothetical protein FRX31_026385 [Thalictrum thalictroides]|uniref:Uncharacterized protein n=1 Tax=Thalictrum thalictroides TaxID=46969 RepID=A0A7J6VG01_THATH|nr:hypothetical protein FRX31_026385 [Thalictrum thalictroides]
MCSENRSGSPMDSMTENHSYGNAIRVVPLKTSTCIRMVGVQVGSHSWLSLMNPLPESPNGAEAIVF